MRAAEGFWGHRTLLYLGSTSVILFLWPQGQKTPLRMGGVFCFGSALKTSDQETGPRNSAQHLRSQCTSAPCMLGPLRTWVTSEPNIAAQDVAKQQTPLRDTQLSSTFCILGPVHALSGGRGCRVFLSPGEAPG
jgi:hypothetical protein